MAGSETSHHPSHAAPLRALAAIAMLALAAASGPASAAPLRPMTPVDVCGVIHFSDWLPPRSLPPVVGMSGSAGHQREWPGRFVVVLTDVRGANGEAIQQINAVLKTSSDGKGIAVAAGQLLLVLAGDDPSLLDSMKSLCVTGFVVSGDEGGTWTRYRALQTFATDQPDAQ